MDALHLVIRCCARVWIVDSFFHWFSLRPYTQAIEPYVTLGIITVLYNQYMCFGLRPHFLPMALLVEKSAFLAFWVVILMCSFQFSLSSIVIPRYFTVFESLNMSLPMRIVLG